MMIIIDITTRYYKYAVTELPGLLQFASNHMKNKDVVLASLVHHMV